MKQIVVISGKGGTGKTVITAAFAALAQKKIIVDCDVDAPDMHLLLAPNIQEKHLFKAGVLAKIDPDKCTGCNLCSKSCPANSISGELKEPHLIDQQTCIKCSMCFEVCPVQAITREDFSNG